MEIKQKPTWPKKRKLVEPGRKNVLNRLVEHRLIEQVSYDHYRRKVRNVYDGPKGALLATASKLSLHMAFGERLLRLRKFDLRGRKRILDVGSGAGQILQHLVKYADSDATITGFDLSTEMLRRARRRVARRHRHHSIAVPRYLAADMTRLPFADASFDCITCGYVLEHVPDPRSALAELARVMAPGARMLLLTTEDNFGGAWTSRLWYCRTYNRRELLGLVGELGLVRRQELWFSQMHKLLRAGGICVELQKAAG